MVDGPEVRILSEWVAERGLVVHEEAQSFGL
jgi:hypothetical protein